MTDSPEESDDALLRLFARFDTNGDGLIRETEFRKILQSLGESPSDEVLSLEFAAIDANTDGMVEFQEFKAWWLDFK
jgi:Ca2+-binding EF-hand superfamily protein